MIEKLKRPVTEDIYGKSNLDFYFQDLDGQYNSPHFSNLPHFLQGLFCNKMSYIVIKKSVIWNCITKVWCIMK